MAGDKPSIVFFGSGPVAANSLELLSAYCDIEAVITKPQPAHHKEAFPVLALAERMGLKVLTPYGKKELSELFATKPVTSKLGIVIDYGFIINQDVIDYFPLGIINSHFSILPEWRGADPITFAILSGQDVTGVSLMVITAGMDEGPLIAYGEHPLEGTETTPQLTESLIQLSDALLRDELPRYINKQITAPQSMTGREVSYSRKLTKADSILDFTKPADQLEREIRAYAEWPKSRTVLGDKEVIVTKAHLLPQNVSKIGTIWLGAKQFGFQTSHGILVVDALKPAGKGEMTAEAFLAGYKHLLEQ
ncbi:MAG: fmt, methionyl-tRNA formyltransferase [Candidatus Saccharibacteria bacterium]|nr:fmt, methionyl-tRNA formyltransferase [Candidatus Saccharibacteria bacterium]